MSPKLKKDFEKQRQKRLIRKKHKDQEGKAKTGLQSAGLVT